MVTYACNNDHICILNLQLGNLRLDRPDQSQAYSVAESQPLDPTHRHYVNDVAEKPYYNEKIRVCP